MAGSTPGSGTADPVATILAAPASSRSVRERRWRILRRAARARLAPFGAAVMLLAVAVAVLAPVVAPYNPLKQDLNHPLARPDRIHLLGTDNVGRDVLSRVIFGTRVSLAAGFGSVVIAVLAGRLLRPLAGLAGGPAGRPVNRLIGAGAFLPPPRLGPCPRAVR